MLHFPLLASEALSTRPTAMILGRTELVSCEPACTLSTPPDLPLPSRPPRAILESVHPCITCIGLASLLVLQPVPVIILRLLLIRLLSLTLLCFPFLSLPLLSFPFSLSPSPQPELMVQAPGTRAPARATLPSNLLQTPPPAPFNSKPMAASAVSSIRTIASAVLIPLPPIPPPSSSSMTRGR